MRTLTFNERLLIIFKRREAGLTNAQLSKKIHMCKSNLSRLENGIISMSEDNMILFENEFNIDFSLGDEYLLGFYKEADQIVHLLVFYKMFELYPKSNLDNVKSEISKSVAYPVFMLVKLFIFSVKNIEWEFVKKYINIFEKIAEYFAPKYQKLFYISKLNYLYSYKKYQEAIDVCLFIENSFEKEDLIDSYLLHIKSILYGCIGRTDIVMETLDKAIVCADNTNNTVRLIALYITKANCFKLMGEYDEALNFDFRTLDFCQSTNTHIYDYILYRNTGWTYYLLSDYKNAIKYYKIAEKLDIDDDLCFMTAYSSFCLAEVEKSGSKKSFLRHQCRDYLKLGKTVKNSGIAFPYLIDWLNLMLQKKYSMKAEQKLLYCLKKHENTMHIDSRNNIYKFLAEHYEYHHDDDKARIYREKLKKK